MQWSCGDSLAVVSISNNIPSHVHTHVCIQEGLHRHMWTPTHTHTVITQLDFEAPSPCTAHVYSGLFCSALCLLSVQSRALACIVKLNTHTPHPFSPPLTHKPPKQIKPMELGSSPSLPLGSSTVQCKKKMLGGRAQGGSHGHKEKALYLGGVWCVNKVWKPVITLITSHTSTCTAQEVQKARTLIGKGHNLRAPKAPPTEKSTFRKRRGR